MRINNSDNWFYKAGIVGFDRIIRYNEDFCNLDSGLYNYVVHDNYIEFDEKLLENFHKYYFNYFFGRYNSAKDQEEKIRFYIRRCEKEDKFKDNLGKIRELVKNNNKKIKKFEVKEVNRCLEIQKELGMVKKYSEKNKVEELLNEYIDILKDNYINTQITLNKFKSILSKSFFGQVSFLNVCNNSKTLAQQEDILFKDYIDPILVMCKLNEILKKNDEEMLREFIEECLLKNKRNGEIEKVLKDFKKGLFGKIRKEKDAMSIFMQYNSCSMCGNEVSIGSNYYEGNFVPLAISNENAENMYWNFNTKHPICSLCKLILLCTSAGMTDIYKGYLDDKYDYNNKLYYGFISIDGDLRDVIKQNNNLANKKDKDSKLQAYILDSIAEKEQISKWQLDNILYIEFNTDYSSKNTKMNYLNIPRYLAEFLKSKSELLYKIKDKKVRVEIFDAILKQVDLKHLIDKFLRSTLQENEQYVVNVFPIIKVRVYLKLYKGECDMVDKLYDKKLNYVYMQGREVGGILKSNSQENKILGLSYRLLNATKATNKKEFMDTVIRIFMSVEKEVPMIFLDVIKEGSLEFEDISYSFISGLTSQDSKIKEGGEK
ncbi:CRISPR-associated protein CXXC_CXXC region [Clostridium bornimense]|uniref:CRISPR-associated protein CXXC_CXXC region n=1 Tax=Clostridium bornimense TaxID=1216932 RepID=W6RZB8_9CLOT|nr:type I-B CRISPR-associated protein Cas8b1/Cst1 [Clostridium bornimense]CDM67377.1 CRISPR-associated protein CXXC_CXXC region [Clostridium bornimense]